jgi:methionyl-tRNA formyltransferase
LIPSLEDVSSVVALRILFLGTGTFAQPSFEALVRSEHQVAGLVTQPDRTGPGKHSHAHPLKEAALAAGIPVFQPVNVNLDESLEQLRGFAADLFVVAAYGQILKSSLLAIPRLGAINLHASLLPRHRGAAPINYAILAGDAETGISIFQIEPRLDAGAVLGRVRTEIGRKETAGQLEERLSVMAPSLLLNVLSKMEQGTAQALPQDASLVTRSPKMPKSFGAIDWSQPFAVIERHIRAMQPWPTAYSFLHAPGQAPLRLVVLDIEPVEVPASLRDRPAGSCMGNEGRFLVRTGDGAVDLLQLQPAGKRMMEAGEFLRGRSIGAEARLTPQG